MTNIEKAQDARKEKILQTRIRFADDLQNRTLTWKEFISEALRLKWQATTKEVNKIKDMSRTAFNRATGPEQERHERRQREAGTKTEYRIGHNGIFYEVPKIVYDEFEMERLFSFEYIK